MKKKIEILITYHQSKNYVIDENTTYGLHYRIRGYAYYRKINLTTLKVENCTNIFHG